MLFLINVNSWLLSKNVLNDTYSAKIGLYWIYYIGSQSLFCESRISCETCLTLTLSYNEFNLQRNINLKAYEKNLEYVMMGNMLYI